MRIPVFSRWRKKHEVINLDREIEENRIIVELEEFCNLGDRFSYLGITMVCTGYGWGEPYLGWTHGIVADYVNSEGEIVEKRFHHCDLEVLKKEDARS